MSDKEKCDAEIRALLEVIAVLTKMLLQQYEQPKAPVIRAVETFVCK